MESGKVKKIAGLENIKIALRSIRSQLLRTVLTIMIIAIGITALVGILTAIDSIKAAINKEFAIMGANTFSIRNRGSRVQVGKRGKKPKRYKVISYQEAMAFREGYTYPSKICISSLASWNATLKYKNLKTNPNITVFGGDENYLVTSGYDIDKGRNFTSLEIKNNAHTIIIGPEVANTLFPIEDPIDKVISVGNGKYKIIGVLKERGSSMGMSGDKNCIIPITSARQYYATERTSYVINVLTYGPQHLDPAISEATGMFRVIRKVALKDEENFELSRSDNLASVLIENLKFVTIAATIIGIITLMGAAIGLMNIMLVSVSERTREIGIRKAMGATSLSIKRQFLTEAIIICQLGGLIGVILGVTMGNVVGALMDTSFIIPWLWIISGFMLCFGVGLIAGYYPASKASKLDPIDALRYE